jgi:tetratricopeptide (TPR) repeat protein
MNEAVEAYRKAIELRPERADGYIGLGVALVKKKDYEASLSPLRKGVEINNQAADAHLFLGLAEMQLGDLASAERDLLAGYRLGKSTVAHIYLANVYELMGQQAKAIEHLEAFISENPQSPSLTQIREAIEKLKKQRSRKQ